MASPNEEFQIPWPQQQKIRCRVCDFGEGVYTLETQLKGLQSPDGLPFALAEWLKQHPDLVVQCTMPLWGRNDAPESYPRMLIVTKR